MEQDDKSFRAAIEAAIAKLPLKADANVSDAIDELEQFASIVRHVRPMLDANKRPAFQRKISTVKADAIQLADSIKELQTDLLRSNVSWEFIEETFAIRRALEAFAQQSETLPLDEIFNARGQPKKIKSRLTGQLLATIYHQLTGEPPRLKIRHRNHQQANQPYGPWLDFIADILRTLEIPDAPASVARDAQDWYRENHPT